MGVALQTLSNRPVHIHILDRLNRNLEERSNVDKLRKSRANTIAERQNLKH